MLRAQQGQAFQDAADVYEQTSKRVFLVSGDHQELGGPRGANRDGENLTWWAGSTKVGAVYLNSELAEGDLLLAAAHEARVHMSQAVPMSIGSDIDGRDIAAFGQLPTNLQQLAPRFASFGFLRLGLSVPGVDWGNIGTIIESIGER